MTILINPSLGANQKLYAGGSNCVLKDWTFGGATPTTFVDKSGSGNHGTFTDITMAQLASGLWTYQFNGSTSYIDVADTLGLDITARPLTIAVWANLAADAGNGYAICRNTAAANDVQYGVYFVEHSYLYAYLRGFGRAQTPASSVTLGTWQLAGFTWAADGTIQCYLNGAASGNSASYTETLTSRTTVSVGRRVDDRYLKGSLTIPRILPVEWTAADWLKAYNMERKYFGV
jgi:hypothetical protein